MEIVTPEPRHIPGLAQLWRLAFGDEEAIIQGFFATGFAPQRCRCLVSGSRVAAALYWFDCACRGRKLAYLYAVATHPDHRRQGLCHRLMADARRLLEAEGYSGILLMPAGASQRRLYAAMGYETCTKVAEFSCAAGVPLPLKEISPEEYGRLRRDFLPAGGVLQEGSALTWLHTFARFYTGEDFLLAAAAREDSLLGMELLGRQASAPGILAALGLKKGTFRAPGGKIPFAMYLPLDPTAQPPDYFGLALD